VVYCWRRVQGREQANAIREVIVRNRRRILNPDEGGALVTTSGGPSSTTQWSTCSTPSWSNGRLTFPCNISRAFCSPWTGSHMTW